MNNNVDEIIKSIVVTGGGSVEMVSLAAEHDRFLFEDEKDYHLPIKVNRLQAYKIWNDRLMAASKINHYNSVFEC